MTRKERAAAGLVAYQKLCLELFKKNVVLRERELQRILFRKKGM